MRGLIQKNNWEKWTFRIVSGNTKYDLTSEFTEYDNPTVQGNPHLTMHLSTYVCTVKGLLWASYLQGTAKCYTMGKYMEKNQERTGRQFHEMLETK